MHRVCSCAAQLNMPALERALLALHRHTLPQQCLMSYRTHTEIEDDQEHDSAEERIPTAWWVGGLILSGAFCTAMLTPMLDLPVIDPLAAVGLALLVAVLAVRALGQTDLNPVSGVGKLSQVCINGESKLHMPGMLSFTVTDMQAC